MKGNHKITSINMHLHLLMKIVCPSECNLSLKRDVIYSPSLRRVVCVIRYILRADTSFTGIG